LSNKRSSLFAEAHVAWEVASLFRFDGGNPEDGADSPDVSDQVVALRLVTLDQIGSLRKRNGGIRFACG